MSTFDLAIPVVLQHEGGWVSDSADPGGETNFGISSLMIAREGISASDLGLDPSTPMPYFQLQAGAQKLVVPQAGYLKSMTVDAAQAIYRKYFWDCYNYSSLADQKVATKIFDACVNMGAHHAHPLAQQAANAATGTQHLAVDGILGTVSMQTINAIDPGVFIRAYTATLYGYYHSVVAAHPAEAKFLSNWLKRASWGT